MNPLNHPNFLRLNRKEIVTTCVMHPLSETTEGVLNNVIAVDLRYYRIRWDNGVETILAISSNQRYANSRQIVQAYCSAIAHLLAIGQEADE